MQALIDFLRLCRAHWCLGCAAFGAVLVARIALLILPFRILQRMSEKPQRVGTLELNRNIPRRSRVAFAVRTASHLVPGATCLSQALAAQALLRLRGDSVNLCLGAARSDQGTFEAHAWLEADGTIVIGDLPDLDRYQRFALPITNR